MKFGRFHGIALCALGLLLLFAQGVISMRRSVPEEQDQPVRTLEDKNPLPFMGGMGLLILLVGGALIATQPKRTLPEELGTDESGQVHRDEIRETAVKR
jgi:hypothetical protein